MSRPMRVTTSLLLILILALVLRLISLADHSLWYDEAFSVLFARQNLAAMLSGTVGAVEHPLLYYLSLNMWLRLLGETALTARLWSVLTGLLAAAVLYHIARSLFGARAALAAGLIGALAPFLVQYAQEARMYSQLLLLLLLTTAVYLHGWEDLDAGNTGRWGRWVAVGVLAGLALHTQQLAVFFLAGLGLFPLVLRRWDVFLRMCLSGAVALVIFLPWLVQLPAQIERLNAQYWIQQPGIIQPLLSARIFLAGGLEMDIGLSMLVFAAAVVVTILALVQVLFESRRRRPKDRRVQQGAGFVAWMFLVPLVMMWLFSQAIPVYLERALIASAAMLLLLVSWFIVGSAAPLLIRGLAGVLLAVLFAAGLLAQYQLGTFPYSPVHDLVRFVQEQAAPGDVVVHMNKLSALPGEVYAPDLEQRFLADPPGSPVDTLAPGTQAALGVQEDACIQSAVGDAVRVWLVTYARAEQQYEETGSTELADVQNWLASHYTLTDRHTFQDLNLYQYENPSGSWTTDCL